MRAVNDSKSMTAGALAAVDGESAPWFRLDVRTPAEFRGLHMPDSVNVPLADLAHRWEWIRESAAGKPIALICRTGRRAQNAQTAFTAQSLQSYVLEGGVEDWTSAGHPVVRGKAGMSLERQVRIAAGTLVVVGAVLGLLIHSAFVGLAAFVGAGLVFAGVTDTCGMALVLGRMPWNRSGATSPTPNSTGI